MAGIRLTSRAQIAKLLSTPTWSVQELLSGSSSATPKISNEQIAKLIKQCGLKTVDNQQALDSIRSEFARQLQFVELLKTVNTEGLEPLVRIGDDVKLSYENITAPPCTIADEVAKGWKPTELAAVSDGNMYVLKEGLQRDE